MTGAPEVPARETDAGEPATRSFIELICSILEEKRAEDIVWLDVSDVTDIADDFVIATILNTRQGAAIVEECEKNRKRLGLGRVGIEGQAGSSWILLDYADVIVHLFLAEQRAYYALEHLWADAKRIR